MPNEFKVKNGLIVDQGGAIITGSTIISGSVTITGSVNAASITGSLLGTSSWSNNSLTASFITSSNVFGPFGSNSVLSASYAATSSITELSNRTTRIDVYVKNVSGAQINKGTVVRITGATGDNPLIGTASYTDDNNSANTLGITTQDFPNDSFGYVISEGVLTGIDTSAFTAGQLVYLGPTGSIIGTAPQAPLHAVRLGEILRSQLNNGSMYVRIDNGYEIEELHDVRIISASSGDLTVRSGSVWINSKQLTGSYGLTGSLNLFGSFILSGSLSANDGVNVESLTASFINATSGITGSLFGTASWANNAISSSISSTASFVNTLNQNVIISGGGLTIITGSGVEFQISALGAKIGNLITDVHTLTGSLSVSGSITASLFGTSSFATTASFALNGGVTQIIAGTNVTISPTNGLGAVTINSTGGGGGGSITVADEGSTQGTATYFDFTGAGVTATVSNNTASISIPGGGGSAFPFTGSALITGSLGVTGSISSTDGFTGSLFGTASYAVSMSNMMGYLNTTFDGMGSVILINTLDSYRVPKAGTIMGWSVVANGTWPTMSFNVLDGASSICGNNFPFISGSTNFITSSNLTDWTTSFAANDIFTISVRSSSVATRASLMLDVMWS